MFYQSLGPIRRVNHGLERVRDDLDRDDLRHAFEEDVFGVREVLSAFNDEPMSADTMFEAFAPAVPN